jgi:hypothetical protein
MNIFEARGVERYLDPVTARIAPQARGLAHITAETPDGLRVWPIPTAKGIPRCIRTSCKRCDSGLPQPNTERYEVARFVLAPNAATAAIG